MAMMTLKKWKRIGRICGYDGTRTASVWSKDADRLRKACSYELWKKMAQNNGWSSPFSDVDNDIPSILRGDERSNDEEPNWSRNYIPNKNFVGTAYRDGHGWVVKSEDGADFKVTNPEILFNELKNKGRSMPSFEFEVYCSVVEDGRCKVFQIK